MKETVEGWHEIRIRWWWWWWWTRCVRVLEYEEAIYISKVISLTCWKLDPADIGLPLIIVHAVWGKLLRVYIHTVYDMHTMCMYILK